MRQSGRRMYLNLSSKLNHDYLGWWEQWSNGRRIDGDIEAATEAMGLIRSPIWANVALRFTDLLPWQQDASSFLGWNDLDSLEVGNTANTTYPSNTPEIAQPSNPPAAPTSLAGTPALVDGLTERSTANRGDFLVHRRRPSAIGRRSDHPGQLWNPVADQ